jgi:fumarate reductase flavoprotein subunit
MKHLKADVVVISAGSAGLAATVAAAQTGAKVITFEKASTTGGAGNFAHGLLAIDSHIQRKQGIKLSVEEAFKIHMEVTHWQADARLVKTYYAKTASTIEWLEKMGIEFSEITDHGAGNKLVWHIVKTEGGFHSGKGQAMVMLQVLTEKAGEYGAQILLKTPVKQILKVDGKITGVIAEDESGEEIRADAGAVIVATGGFLDNAVMLKKYAGFKLETDMFPVRKNHNLTGDGIRMAWEVGAAPTLMNLQMAHDVPNLEFMPLFRQVNILVNMDGERFMNEEATSNTTYFGNAISRQKNKWAFMIVDEDTKKNFEKKPASGPPGMGGSIEEQFKRAFDKGNRHIFIADSLEDLCSKTGINPAGLKKTLDEYNSFCQTGRDELFFVKPENLHQVKQPKFYAGRIMPHGLGTLGGIRINHRIEVLNKNLNVIPGLYAAGLDANSLYGDSYPWIMSGNTFGFAINSGRMAGENAVTYIRSLQKA